MAQFILIAYDATDAQAGERRLAARQAHTQAMVEMREKGRILCGIAITDETSKMIGSVLITDFASRSDFDAWLAEEPYVTGKVWDKIEVLTGQLGGAFADLLK